MDNNERFGRIEEVLADVLIEMHGVNAKIDVLNTKFDTLNTKFDTLNTSVDALNTSVSALQQGQQQIIRTFDHFAGAVLAKMDQQTAELKGMREDIKLLHNHEERLRKVEAVVFQKGAL
ncbi:MAG: hypothetical protein AVDCRST_MAG56-3152 [uncultured Cytophagales bacterium]|uniref:Uncharacterized protein n=1 Tax=uncultured Cytophagales bacterium TaxID=158755 RepID=A0A6J4JBY6_9SPHI|nr:MAG: hypothetical protein AVDCRST_MAG56-3152 [uncultured Cytophagales bacterium]